MKIVFNLHNVGLGNNGGSRTIIRCAETLQTLGCQCFLYSNHENKYSWSKISVPVIKKPIPCDVIVATGYGSVKSTINYKCKKKFYYIRGFEKWTTSEKNLVSSYKSGLKCIVNSEWLLRLLKSFGVESNLVYQGIDFEQFYLEDDRDRVNVLGGLFHSRHLTKRHKDIFAVAKRIGCPLLMLNKDIKDGNPEQIRNFYNKTSVWMAPTELEGLHNPPMEASLCGNAIIRTSHLRCGMSDYATPETSLIYEARNISQAADCVDRLFKDENLRRKLVSRMNELLIKKIGSRKDNMKKMIYIFEA